ncbi:hypothetical protein KSS87_012798, partial [Heliosperma pusillum]
MQTMGNEARKTLVHIRSYKANNCNEARTTHVHTRSYKCNNGMKQEDSLFTQGVTMQQWVVKQGRLIVHTRSYNVTMGNKAWKTHCSHKELQWNNGFSS